MCLKYISIHLYNIFIGVALIVHHLRQSVSCGGYEELAPIDQNLQYDFNFQEAVFLPDTINVLPVG